MPRYFIEVSYKGTNYGGFQIQQNSNTIQAEIEKALNVFFRSVISLTGSSRTDAGVHALQNFFHFDSHVLPLPPALEKAVYNLNAILPPDILIKSICLVADEMHCRFDARQREYQYFVYQQKDPFNDCRAYYYPYKLDIDLLQQAAKSVLNYEDFSSFCKRNTQVKTFICNIAESSWKQDGASFTYTVKANRFLRGMVRGLVGTMLKVGTGKISAEQFIAIIESRSAVKTDFSVPAHGLFLIKVNYGPGILHPG